MNVIEFFNNPDSIAVVPEYQNERYNDRLEKKILKKNINNLKSFLLKKCNLDFSYETLEFKLKNGKLNIYNELDNFWYDYKDFQYRYYTTFDVAWVYDKEEEKLLFTTIEFDNVEKGYYAVYTSTGVTLAEHNGESFVHYTIYDKYLGAKKMDEQSWVHFYFLNRGNKEDSRRLIPQHFMIYKEQFERFRSRFSSLSYIGLRQQVYQVNFYSGSFISLSLEVLTHKYELDYTKQGFKLLILNKGVYKKTITGTLNECLDEIEKHIENDKIMFPEYHTIKNLLGVYENKAFYELSWRIYKHLKDDFSIEEIETKLKNKTIEIFSDKGKWDLHGNCYIVDSDRITSLKIDGIELPLIKELSY